MRRCPPDVRTGLLPTVLSERGEEVAIIFEKIPCFDKERARDVGKRCCRRGAKEARRRQTNRKEGLGSPPKEGMRREREGARRQRLGLMNEGKTGIIEGG
jgi:hypothetical protein